MQPTAPLSPPSRPGLPRRTIAIAAIAGIALMALVYFALTGARRATRGAIAGLLASPTSAPTIASTLTAVQTTRRVVSPPSPTPSASKMPQSGAPTTTLTPSATPTAKRKGEPTLWLPFTPVATQLTPIPTPAARYQFDKGVVNILLTGSDIGRQDIEVGRGYQTDSIIIASVNKDEGYVTLLSIPRDLYVYLPGAGMGRINTADLVGKPFFPGGGPAYLEQTILYNLGIPIDYYARINFDGFKDIVNTLGGIDVPVTCAIQDWRLKSPDLDPQVEDNWYLFTQETGLIHMDGELALWYARSRKNNTDFDRSRRQMQVLRAIYHTGKSLDILPQVPALFQQFQAVVQSDMGIGDVLQFVPIAAKMDAGRIRSFSVNSAHTTSWTTPGEPSQNVLLPRPDALGWLFDDAFGPPDEAETPTLVEVWNGTANADWLALATDNLRARGYSGVAGAADRQDYPSQVLYDFTNGEDTETRSRLQKLFGVNNANVIARPDTSGPYPYRIVLGADWNSCIYNVPLPKPTPTP